MWLPSFFALSIMQLLIVRTKASINLCFMSLQGFLLERKPGDAADIIQVLNQVPTIFWDWMILSNNLFSPPEPPPPNKKKRSHPVVILKESQDC